MDECLSRGDRLIFRRRREKEKKPLPFFFLFGIMGIMKNEGGLIMSIEKVRDYLRTLGAEERIREFPVSSATVELAAAALGCAPARIAKTLSFGLSGGVILIVAAGDARIDNRKYKDFFGEKARMLPHEEVAAAVGHAVGGVCPFAVAEGVRVYLDESLRRFPTVFPAAGSSNSAVEVTPDELEGFVGRCEWVDVCKLPEGQ